MLKVLFVCHGNICRSPMAEFACKQIVSQLELHNEFEIASAATSQEELGNRVYPPAAKLLKSYQIDCSHKRARQIKPADFDYYDYILLMEQYNLDNLYRLYPAAPQHKIHLLLDFCAKPHDIEDPWYSGRFAEVFEQIVQGIASFLIMLNAKGTIKLDHHGLEHCHKLDFFA